MPRVRRIAELKPQAVGSWRPSMSVLSWGGHLIENRADEFVARPQRDHEPWLTAPGHQLADRHDCHVWHAAAPTIAAYALAAIPRSVLSLLQPVPRRSMPHALLARCDVARRARRSRSAEAPAPTGGTTPA
jgi:hypothetical protein